MQHSSAHKPIRILEPVASLLGGPMVCHRRQGRILPPFIHPDTIEKLKAEWDTDAHDIFICSHQKVGTHLTKKFVVEILRRVYAYPQGHGMEWGDIGHDTVPWPEVLHAQYGQEVFLDHLKKTSAEPRVWYMHCQPEDLPFRSVHPDTKFIYVYRDPKAAVVSQYFFYKSHPLLSFPQEMSMEAFVDLFLEGALYFGDYHQHVSDWKDNCQQQLDSDSLLFLRYEDLVERKEETAGRLLSFMSKVTLSPLQMLEVIESTRFETMKNRIIEKPGSFHFNPSTFFRAGKINDWEDKLSAESIRKIDEKTMRCWSRELTSETGDPQQKSTER